jgi:hypothetical protein
MSKAGPKYHARSAGMSIDHYREVIDNGGFGFSHSYQKPGDELNSKI